MPNKPRQPNTNNPQLKSGVVLVNKVPAGKAAPKPKAPSKGKK